MKLQRWIRSRVLVGLAIVALGVVAAAVGLWPTVGSNSVATSIVLNTTASARSTARTRR